MTTGEPVTPVDPCEWVRTHVTAGRVAVRRGLAHLRDLEPLLEVREADVRRGLARRPVRRALAWAEAAWASRDALVAWFALGPVGADDATLLPVLVRADVRVRARLYETLLARREAGRPRQVLHLDPAGRGRAIELHGSLTRDTRHLVVVVPGTGTAMRGFHMPSQVAADLVAADPAGGTAAIAWMGADFPQGFANQASLAHYAVRAAGPLVAFVDSLPVPEGCDVTVLGHSYGGVVVGAAERRGLRTDRVIHVAGAGAGPSVRSADDYATTDTTGRLRNVRRFSITAPGDPIRWVQRYERRPPGWTRRLPAALRRVVDGVAARVDLGVDPARLEGVVVLESGGWSTDGAGHHAGDPLAGPSAHAAIVTPATEAFASIAAAARGERDRSPQE